MKYRRKIAVKMSAREELALRNYAASFADCCILDSNSKSNFTVPGGIQYDFLIAFGSLHSFESKPRPDAFDRLHEFHQKQGDWLLGHFNYEMKNATEKLTSSNAEFIHFPDCRFFVPQYIFIKENDDVYGLLHEREAGNLSSLLKELQFQSVSKNKNEAVFPEPVLTKSEYIKKVSGLKHHIKMGDIYEANFCQNFAACGKLEKPYAVYEELRNISPTPYGAFYRVNANYLMCASPENYLQKRGMRLTSRPIKGTSKRGTTRAEDAVLRDRLYRDEKERAENVMIVDLVRNDLSRCAAKESVKVEELFGIYEFPGVHQMISTVCSVLKPGVPFTDAFKYTFPPGSMTGAPKIRAMELIEGFEAFKRNIYSGSVGYITPAGHFDFNVVIRSIFYSVEKEIISFAVGGAITDMCNAESEYEESLLKAQNLIKVLKAPYS